MIPAGLAQVVRVFQSERPLADLLAIIAIIIGRGALYNPVGDRLPTETKKDL